MPETASFSAGSPRFGDLRGVQWRVDLGILPSSPSASIDDLRRVTADSRRSYASLRKQLLVDPHLPKDGGSSPDLVMDNPLSQNPDSMWGRFFKNAELERTVDKDLTRLYPERGSYFQTSACQGMLRRILLLWCLRHPECGYRQGMHELLAPLLYVLHVDVDRLLEVRKSHEDHFTDQFDALSYHEGNSTYKFDFKKLSKDSTDDSDAEFKKKTSKLSSLADLDLVTKTIVLLSDAYGAEGELGTVLSEKFTEHDAYSMFDALMSGTRGVVAMSDFFSPSPNNLSHSGFTPMIEASSAVYHLLSAVDPSLHTHLVELGVEPQYFSLRWLRVLFGREFSLENLLIIWDEIFSCDNNMNIPKEALGSESYFRVLESARGAFISAFAVSMILKLRSSLLATEYATLCLQRLLNFPNDVNVMELISKAKSLQTVAIDVKNSLSPSVVNPALLGGKKPVIFRGHMLPKTNSTSPKKSLKESYWEEKWRVVHNENDKICRTKSDPNPTKETEKKEIQETSVRRSLLEDLARQLQDDNKKNAGCSGEDKENVGYIEDNKENGGCKNGHVKHQDSSEVMDEKVSNVVNYPELCDQNSHGESENSSVASNSCTNESDAKRSMNDDIISSRCIQKSDLDSTRMSGASGVNGRRKNKCKSCSNEGEVTKVVIGEDVKQGSSNGESGQISGNECDGSSDTSKGEIVDQNLKASLRNLGQSMLENIKVIESALQEQKGGGWSRLSKSSSTKIAAISALEELRKISRILSDM